jgi:hypothetical protein
MDTLAFSPPSGPELPYSRIPDAPDNYSAGKVAARVIDGLGFRFYWATESLRDTDLAYKPSEKGRTTAETIDHIYGLSRVILNTVEQKPNIPGNDGEHLSFEETRAQILHNLKRASDLLKRIPDSEIIHLNMVFGEGENSSEFPFWNLLNGPIADAIYHTGQVVSFRRSSGNSINPKVRVLTGTVSE